GLEHAEQVVEAVVEGVWVALDVEEEVARRWRRQRGKTPLGLDRPVRLWKEQLVMRPLLAATLELDPGLPVDPAERAGTRALERRRHRQRQLAKGFQRPDAAQLEGVALAGGDPGHE